MVPESPDWMGQIEATAPEPRSGARRGRQRVGLQCQDKSGTGVSQAAGPGPPSQPHVQDKLLPTQGTRRDEGTAGHIGEGGQDRGARLQECAMGTLRHPLRPGLGLLPPRSRLSKLTFPQHPRLKLVLLKPSAPRTPEEFKDRSAAERLHLCSLHRDLSKAAAPEPAAVPSPCPGHCPGASLLSRDGKQLPNGRTRHTPALGTGIDGTIFGDGRDADPALRRLPTAPHELGGFVPSSWQQEASQHFRTHNTRGLRRELNYLAKSQGHASSQKPSWRRIGGSRKVEFSGQTTQLWVN